MTVQDDRRLVEEGNRRAERMAVASASVVLAFAALAVGGVLGRVVYRIRWAIAKTADAVQDALARFGGIR